MKANDSEKLQNEYEKLVEGLRQAEIDREEELFMSNPVLPKDLLDEAIPGNIRKAEHFISFLKRFIEYLKTRMKVLHVISETPVSFLQHLKELTFIDKKPLRFCSEVEFVGEDVGIERSGRFHGFKRYCNFCHVGFNV